MTSDTKTPFTPTAETFDQDVLQASQPVLVDFWAPWCGPCKSMKPDVEALAEELDGKARVAFVNVDEHPELAQRFEIMSIPALRVFRDGKLVDGHNGRMPLENLRDFVKKAL